MTDMLEREPDSRLNVYFIDDSATMREVVKNAFRHENFNIVTCSDMASAVAHFDLATPHAVISDVIMPDKDGYQLCQYVKQHPVFGGTPVFLMSGVVNKEVAERANDVMADELIRKPFHPQDLVARVKKILLRAEPEQAPAPAPASTGTEQSNSLSQLFEGADNLMPQLRPMAKPAVANPRATPLPAPIAPPPASARQAPANGSPDSLKLRMEVRRLEILVKKLQSELALEREYCAELESQLQTVSTAE